MLSHARLLRPHGLYSLLVSSVHGISQARILEPGKLMEAGAVEGFIIQYVNDQQVKTPQDVIDIVKKSKRAVFVEGITPSGRTGYFGFGV